MTPREVLAANWGYTDFRPCQLEIIESVLAGRDTLGLLPTGGGKSITFQVPALMLEGMTLVVTPLISLMKDQVDNLAQIGVRSGYLYSGMSRREHNLVLDRCVAGRSKLLYISPEKLSSKSFTEQLATLPVSMIVVDEAHCISQWGYDFRPAYLRIADVRTRFPEAPVLALTASATPRVSEDIMNQLKFREPRMFARSFARPNLSYVVRHSADKPSMLLRVLRNTSGSSIVYVRSRKRTRELALMLTEAGISAEFYHAGLDAMLKSEKQDKWKRGEVRVMVATNAFGMGIDKADVRVVIHYDIPSSLEEFYQEAGRAGRDGKPAFAVMLAASADKATLTRRISESFPEQDYIRKVYELACNYAGVALGEGYDKAFDFDFNKFVEIHKLKPRSARSAMMLLSAAGYIEYNDDSGARAKIMMTCERSHLYDLDLSPSTEAVLQTVLRSYTGIFADYIPISEAQIAARCASTEDAVYQALVELSRMQVLHYIPRRTLPYLYFPTSRELPKYVSMPLSVYDVRKEEMHKRIKAIKEFAFNDSECRVNSMLRYFGEKLGSPCGKCDVCRAGSTNDPAVDLTHSILYLASQGSGHPIDYVLAQFPHSKRPDVIATVRELLDREEIILDENEILTINKA